LDANLNEKERATVIKRIADFIKKEGSGLGHRRYAFSYLLCTGLNLLNVVVSIFLLDKFIGTSEHKHNFLSLGPLWIDFLGDDTDLKRNEAKSVLTTLFPREVLCQWHEYGSGGYIQWHVYLCLLASNVITEKVFVFLWFWLFFLLILSTGVFIYLSLLLFSPHVTVRNYFLSFAVKVRPKNFWKRDDKSAKEERRLGDYLRNIPAPNFLFLYMLAGNVDRRTMGEILLAVQPKEKETENNDSIYPQIKKRQASAPPPEEVGAENGGGSVMEAINSIVMDEVGEEISKSWIGEKAKEGDKAMKMKERKQEKKMSKSANPAKK